MKLLKTNFMLNVIIILIFNHGSAAFAQDFSAIMEKLDEMEIKITKLSLSQKSELKKLKDEIKNLQNISSNNKIIKEFAI